MPSLSLIKTFTMGLELTMFTAYVVVTFITMMVSTFYAVVDFMHCKFVLVNMARLGLPESSLTLLGSLKAVGAVGLLLGLIGVPVIGTAAAIGRSLFFFGAIVTHVRAGDRSYWFAAMFLLLAVATLVTDLAS